MIDKIETYRKAIVPAFFLIYLGVGLSILPDYGMSWDEAAQRNHGIVTFDYINEFFDLGYEKQRPQSNFLKHPARHYGTWFPLFGYGMENLLGLSDNFRARFLMRHVLVFLLFWTATIFFYKLLKNRFEDWKIALLGTLMLILSPRIFAHSFYNPKDIVLLSCYVISTYTLIRFLQEKSIKYAFAHAAACAFVVNTRIPGVIIPVFTLGLILIEFLSGIFNPNQTQNSKFKISFLTFLTSTIFFTILINPALWTKPAQQFSETFQSMAKFDWSSHLLYWGEFIKGTELPWHYIPSWIAITTPIVYLLFGGIGMVLIFRNLFFSIKQFKLWRDNQERTDLILLSLFALPILAVILKGSTLYDGWRQLYFVYPGLIGVTVLGVKKVIFSAQLPKPLKGGLLPASLEKRIAPSSYSKGISILRHIIAVFFFSGLIHTTYQIIKTHPLQHVWFNSFAGKNLLEKFDRDYWGLSYRQALEELIRRYPHSCISVKMINYPGEENYRFFGPEIRQHVVLKYGPQLAEYYISNYRGWKELGDFRKGRFPYQEEVFSIDIQGEKVIGVYRNLEYEEE